MSTRLKQIFDHCLKEREIVVWGEPSRLLKRELSEYNWAFTERVDPEKHYVVAVTDDDLTDFLCDYGGKGFKSVYDYISFPTWAKSCRSTGS